MSPIPNPAENGSMFAPAQSVISLMSPQTFASAASAFFSGMNSFTKNVGGGASHKTESGNASFITVSHTPSTARTMPDEQTDIDAASILEGIPGVAEDDTPTDHEFGHRLLKYCRKHKLTAGCPHAEEAVNAHNGEPRELERRKGGGGKGGGGGSSSNGGNRPSGSGPQIKSPGVEGGPFLAGYSEDEQGGIMLGIILASMVGFVLVTGGVVYCQSCYKEKKQERLRLRSVSQPWPTSADPVQLALFELMGPDRSSGQVRSPMRAYQVPY